MNSYQINTKAELEKFVAKNWNKLNEYIDARCNSNCPFYNSIDVRESRDKYAPVDNNLYPAGFNNICLFDLNICTDRLKQKLATYNLQEKKIALIPESHTKNLFYLDHLFTLKSCLQSAGYECTLLSLDNELFQDVPEGVLHLTSQSGDKLEIFKGTIANNFITLKSQEFELAILNNDQSKRMEIDWDQIKTIVTPSPHMGWFHRQKIKHFIFYKEVADEFCREFGINPNLIQAQFRYTENVDFETKNGLDLLAAKVQELKDETKTDKIFLKASQGTYGMGIQVVSSAEEVLNMNRKTRNKMDVGKNNIKFQSVLIQEGVETILTCDGHPAEVTIYLVAGKTVGGFMRSNPLKDANSNLNSKGMLYLKYCMSGIQQGGDHQVKEAVYAIIARLSSLACAKEMEETTKQRYN